jgi:hypothetical protein
MSQIRKVQGISMPMTNEEKLELIAQVRELCEKNISRLEDELRYYSNVIGSHVQEMRQEAAAIARGEW